MLAQFKLMILSIFMATDMSGSALNINMDNLDNLKDVACVAQAVQGEAGNQSFEGKVAVAHVILNRTRDERFPDTACAVVRQKGQFDYIPNIKWLNKEKPEVEQQMFESVKAAVAAINGEIPDPTKGALYFANPKIAGDQAWLRNLKKLVKIDDHWFYQTRKQKQVQERARVEVVSDRIHISEVRYMNEK